MAFMEPEIINLRPENPEVKLVCYCAGRSKELPFNEKRKAILIIPGGAYRFCSDREGEPMAMAFLSRGYNAFVLYYSVASHAKYPNPLIDASRAVKIIKDNAEKFCIDPDFVFTIGFSAGGHLAGMLATMWHRKCVYDEIDMPYGYNKVRGAVLCYAVITGGKYAHRGSIDNLLGMEHSENADPAVLDDISIEKHVDERTVPMFLWHTVPDTTVPVQNSLLLAKELADNKIPFEMRIYPDGWHGLSLANETVGVKADFTYVQRWIDDAFRFLDSL